VCVCVCGCVCVGVCVCVCVFESERARARARARASRNSENAAKIFCTTMIKARLRRDQGAIKALFRRYY
jgi:adenylylsulfate kinase-like enzyme